MSEFEKKNQVKNKSHLAALLLRGQIFLAIKMRLVIEYRRKQTL